MLIAGRSEVVGVEGHGLIFARVLRDEASHLNEAWFGNRKESCRDCAGIGFSKSEDGSGTLDRRLPCTWWSEQPLERFGIEIASSHAERPARLMQVQELCAKDSLV